MRAAGALGGQAQGQGAPLFGLSSLGLLPRALTHGPSHTVHGLSEAKQLSSFVEWAELSAERVKPPMSTLYGHSMMAWECSGRCSQVRG